MIKKGKKEKNDDKDEKDEKREKGRPDLDIALRLRNWGWVWLVKSESGLSYEGLDKRFVGGNKQTRTRAFLQIAKRGSSPTNEVGGKTRRNLFAKVHKQDRYVAALRWFRSPLWKLLSAPGYNAAGFSRHARKAIADSECFRVSAEDTQWGKWVLGGDEPCLKSGVTGVFSASVHHFANIDSLNSIALLAAMYREAHAEFEMEIASALSRAVQECVSAHWKGLGLPNWMGNLLEKLIFDRLLRDRWIDGSMMPLKAGQKRQATRSSAREFAAWYCSPSCPARLASPTSFPVVYTSERTRWLEANRRRFQKLYKPLQDFDRTHQGIDDTGQVLATAVLRQQLEASVRERFLKVGSPPEHSLIQALWTGNPKIRITSLPEPTSLFGDDFFADMPTEPVGDDSLSQMQHLLQLQEIDRLNAEKSVTVTSQKIVSVRKLPPDISGNG